MLPVMSLSIRMIYPPCSAAYYSHKFEIFVLPNFIRYTEPLPRVDGITDVPYRIDKKLNAHIFERKQNLTKFYKI